MLKKRQLFTAIDEQGNKVIIDSINKTEIKRYLCPYCKAEVIPKMGEKNVWHFSHKGAVCEFLNLKTTDNLTNKTLDFSNEKTVELSDIEISDCKKFLCVTCKKRFNKESGIKWEGNEYICKECFMKL